MPRRANDDDSAAFLALLEQRAPRPLTIPELARTLGIDRYDSKQVRFALEAEVAKHKLRRIGKTRYQWIREVERSPRHRPARGSGRAKAPRGSGPPSRVEGHYSRVRAGYGFVEVL